VQINTHYPKFVQKHRFANPTVHIHCSIKLLCQLRSKSKIYYSRSSPKTHSSLFLQAIHVKTREQHKSSHIPASPGGPSQFRQALHAEKPRTFTDFESPGGTRIHRQALHPETQ